MAVIDVRKLRMLVELERLGTIAAVADELAVTPPGVSMQLSALEKELGVPLTQRVGRGVVLTPAGVLLCAHGRDILDRLALADLDVTALRDGTIGRYTVTAFPSAARTFLADTYRALANDDGPSIDLRIVTAEPEDALAALVKGSADLALIHDYSNVPRDIPYPISTRALGSERVWLAAPSPQARHENKPKPRRTVRLADYADSNWVAPPMDLTCHDMIERACGVAGFRPRVVAESVDFSVQLSLVAAGVGVALVPELTIDHLPIGVELLALEEPVSRKSFLAVREPRLADPGIQALARIITATANTWLSQPMPSRKRPSRGTARDGR